MNSGIVGIPEDDWCEFGEPESVGYTRTEGSYELNTVLRATDSHRDLEGEYIATSGDAAREEAIEEDSIRVSADDVNIGEVSERTKTAKRTNWVMIPDRFVVVERSIGEFVFNLIAEQGTASIERAEIDLEAFREHFPEAEEWAAGPDGLVRGTLYGRESELERRDLLANNQIGLEGSFNGHVTKMIATRSGYVAAWDLGVENFARFVDEAILPFTEISADDEEDEAQSGLDQFDEEAADA